METNWAGRSGRGRATSGSTKRSGSPSSAPERVCWTPEAETAVSCCEQPVDRRQRGWVSAGALVSVTPGAPALVAVNLQPDGGPVTVSVTGPTLDGWLTTRPGADDVAPGEPLVVDLRFEPASEGREAC